MQGAEHEARARHQLDRLVFFSDAVFAIAITLLILDVRLPAAALRGGLDIGPAMPKLVGFGVGFAVIGLFWLAHHRLFGALRREDGPLRLINLAFLGGVVYLPFPTSLLAEAGLTRAAVELYAWSAAAVGLLFFGVTLAARRARLMYAGEARGESVRLAVRALIVPAVFVATTLVQGVTPVQAVIGWSLMAPVMALDHLVSGLFSRRRDKPV